MRDAKLKTIGILGVFFIFLFGCSETDTPSRKSNALPVALLTVEPRDTPVFFEFVGQAESSRLVQIRSRVDGFLEKQSYRDGELVEAGQILFDLDKKPFEAKLQKIQGELSLQQARHATALATLKRIRPLARQDAVSQKDLDEAIGAEKEAQAAVLAAEGAVREAELNLSYATIRTPLAGQAGKTEKPEGSYIPPGSESLLTYVAQLDPIWVSFSVSENQFLQGSQEEEADRLRAPDDNKYEVEVIFADGRSHPRRGYVNFAEPSVDPQTGTLLVRAELPNPENRIRPGQFLRVRLHGAVRPQAILVPQVAVLQGAEGHFVWVADREGKAETRIVQVGGWHDGDWFIEKGLQAGDRVIVDNLSKLSRGVPVINQPPAEGAGTVPPEKA